MDITDVEPIGGHDKVIARRCINRLECMKYGPKDERPKTKRALQNVLSKENSVIYVSSVLSILYDYPNAVNFSDVDDIFKSDTELDKDVARIVSSRCRTEGRALHVLPCDSDLHKNITAQIKKWYDQKDALFDPENPTRAVAQACYLDHELSAHQIYSKLVHFGYIKEEKYAVALQLPNEDCLNFLENGLNKWEDNIVEHLRDLTIKYYQCFAEIIVETNAAIQRVTAKEMGHYSETEYFKQYPMFKSAVSDGNKVDGNKVDGLIQKLSVEDMDVDQGHGGLGETDDTAMEISDGIPTYPTNTFSLKLPLEAAYALVHLGKIKPPPCTMQEVISHIESICKITYVVSPKYALSSVAAQEKTALVNKADFTMKLHLGKTVATIKKDVSEITQLALLLSFPGKAKVFRRCNKELERIKRYYSICPNSAPQTVKVRMEDINEALKAFQTHIYRRSKQLAERHRSTLVLNNSAAEARCREKIHALLNRANTESNFTLTEEEFSRKLEEFSCEHDYIKSDSVIQTLEELRYLSIDKENVKYHQCDKPRMHPDIDIPEMRKFLTRWRDDQKPRDDTKPKEGLLSVTSDTGRKRQIVMPEGGTKRAKILDL